MSVEENQAEEYKKTYGLSSTQLEGKIKGSLEPVFRLVADEMKKATERKDFEKAVKWRDAIIKIHNETDIYDVLHVVDELWSARNIPSVKPFLDHKPEELSDYIKQYIQPL